MEFEDCPGSGEEFAGGFVRWLSDGPSHLMSDEVDSAQNMSPYPLWAAGVS